MGRLGTWGEDMRVTEYPTEYANGGAYSHQDYPSATRVTLPGTNHFYVLPIGVGAVTQELRAELEAEAAAKSASAAPRNSGTKAGGAVKVSEGTKADG